MIKKITHIRRWVQPGDGHVSTTDCLDFFYGNEAALVQQFIKIN